MLLNNIAEVASELRVSPQTVRRLIYSGRLPAVRIGRRVLVRRQALVRFIMRASRQPSPDHGLKAAAN